MHYRLQLDERFRRHATLFPPLPPHRTVVDIIVRLYADYEEHRMTIHRSKWRIPSMMGSAVIHRGIA